MILHVAPLLQHLLLLRRSGRIQHVPVLIVLGLIVLGLIVLGLIVLGLIVLRLIVLRLTS